MKIELTEDKLLELQQIQRNVTGADYVKVTGILMLNKGLTPRTVSESLGIDVSTVYRYASLYIGCGVTALTARLYKGYRGMLSSHELSLLRTELKRNIHTDSKSICLWIKDSFGVLYTPGGVVDLLKRIGFTYKKTKEVPCESSAEKQEAFVSELSDIISKMDENRLFTVRTVFIQPVIHAQLTHG